MRVLEPRPARVQARLIEIGDMLVSSPFGADGPRSARWLGTVTEHVIADHKDMPSDWRQWRIQLVDGRPTETAVVPADGWIWVHLPSAPLPGRESLGPGMALAAEMMDAAEEDCTPDHGDGQPDCPRCWHRSPRNPRA